MEIKIPRGEVDKVEIFTNPSYDTKFTLLDEHIDGIRESINNGHTSGWLISRSGLKYAWWHMKDKLNPSFAVLEKANHEFPVDTISKKYLRGHQDTYWLSPEDFVNDLQVGNITAKTHYFEVIYSKF